MGVEKIVEVAAEVAETTAPGLSEKVLSEVGKRLPMVGRLITSGKAAEAVETAAKAAPVPDLIMKPEVTKAIMDGLGKGLKEEYPSIPLGSRLPGSLVERPIPYFPEVPPYDRMPRPLSAAEEEARLERLVTLLDDPKVGTPPQELTNAGVGARVWQFGSAGGNVLRERSASQISGRWAPEFQASQKWLSNVELSELPEVTARDPGGPVQNVLQGLSTQFAAARLEVGLRTDNLATCAAIYCKDGVNHFLAHADNMIHHAALTEALEAAGFDLSRIETTILPGPQPSGVLETILPTFLRSPEAMSKLRIMPFRGPGNASVIARNGELYVPNR
jgi:hypothetical protein